MLSRAVNAGQEIEIGPGRAAELAAEGATLVDVREGYERDAGHIEGSSHIELARIAASSGAIDRDRPVVFYCRVGARSMMAASAFRAAGYDAYTLGGGLLAWVDAGLPITPDGGYVAEH
jgi:rhodanese-related sulfurtransferase